MEFFRCCKMCVPPRRHPGCHAGCPDYIDAKKAFNEYRDIEKQFNQKQRDLDIVSFWKRR